MNGHLAAHTNYPADRRDSHDETPLRDGSAGLAAPRLTRRTSLMLMLMLALVLSLTLWTAIWAAVGLFATVVLG